MISAQPPLIFLNFTLKKKAIKSLENHRRNFFISFSELFKEDYVNMTAKEEEAEKAEEKEKHEEKKEIVSNPKQMDDNVYDNCNINLATLTTASALSAQTTNGPQNLSQLASQHDKDKDKLLCPFVGLPAAHLKIMNSPKYGLLYRIEKKIFFDQTKHYYAGVMNRWLLLYSASSNDMKPSMCLYVDDVGIDTIFDGSGKKRENLFHILTNTGKRYQFQALSEDDLAEWITVISQYIINERKSEQVDERSNSSRKLPTPPPASPAFPKNLYQNHRRISVKSEERIYEEPTTVSREESPETQETTNDTLENNYDIVSFNSGQIYSDAVEKPPDLPMKVGKKLDGHTKHEYDTPKPTAAKNLESNDNVESSAVIIDVDSSQIKSDIKGIKVSEMKAILSTQKLSISPPAIEEKKQQKVLMRENDKEIAKENRTPVKSWFMRQINWSGEKVKSRKSGRFSKASTPSPESSPSPENLTKPVKGGKVNMIISQLEANGQLKILSKSLRDRKSLVFDGEEYEPVNIKDNKM